MAGTNASNIGYGNIFPINTSPYVNGANSNYAGGFSSNEIPGQNGLPGLSGAKSNIDAAAGIVPGICMKGGRKNIQRKIKNITRKYKKMKKGQKKSVKWNLNQIRQRARSASASRSASLALARTARGGYRYGHKKTKRGGIGPMLVRHAYKHYKSKKSSKHQKGGYSQYQNNLPMTQTYSLGGHLSPTNSALASPPPVTVLPNCTNCVDNYSRYDNSGFPSRGH
jgi:hypothetical protein